MRVFTCSFGVLWGDDKKREFFVVGMQALYAVSPELFHARATQFGSYAVKAGCLGMMSLKKRVMRRNLINGLICSAADSLMQWVVKVPASGQSEDEKKK